MYLITTFKEYKSIPIYFIKKKSIPILKKLSTFINLTFLITFNDFFSKNIYIHLSKFSNDFLKYLKQLFLSIEAIYGDMNERD